MNLKGHILLIAFSIFAFVSNAQDGEGLFKTKCSMCHMLNKDATGPNLKGVQQKWTDAEEGDLIYDWIKNSTELIASGKSQMALKAEGYSAISMPAQALSKEEVDAVLAYVDAQVDVPKPEEPIAEVAPSSNDTAKEVVYVANYNKNIKLFYWLIIALAIQVLAILMISNALKTVIKINTTSKKIGNNVKAILALIGIFGFMSMNNASLALSFNKAGLAEESAPWLIVEDFDIKALIILNVILLFVLLHFRKLFMDVNHSFHPTKVSKEGKISKRKQRKLNDILTGAVDIEEEHTILMHHEYDGIKELDNNLPPWWVVMFYGTITFAIIYVFNYHILGTSDLQIAEYDKDMAQKEELVQTYLKEQGMQIDASNVTLLTDEADLATGKTIFESNCVVCHNPNGEGNIGPNLTDDSWIYGFDIAEVFTTVKNGTTKGMPEHASKLNPAQLQQVASFVLSLPEFDGGKAPEGDELEL